MIFDNLNYVVLTVIESNLLNCFNSLSQFVNEEGNHNYNILQQKLDFGKIYINEPPSGGAHFCKFLIWEPKNLFGKTAFFSNYQDGKYTLIFNLCRKYKLEAISVNFSNKKHAEYPAFMFMYFNYRNDRPIERTIYLIKDENKWVFFENGEIQPFEDTSIYESRLKTKRFNKEILLSYLLKRGIDIENEQFWQSTNGNAFYFNQISW